MSTIKQVQGSRVSLVALSTLASATYITSSGYNANNGQPLDIVIEAEVTPTTVTGNKQLVIFAKASLDGTNWQSGPESSTTTTDEPDLNLVGVVPMNTASGYQRRMFSLSQSLGFIPQQFKIVVKNDAGAALASGNIYTSEISGTVA